MPNDKIIFYQQCHMITYIFTATSYDKTAVKPVQKGHSQKDRKLFFKTNYLLMQVKSIADCS